MCSIARVAIDSIVANLDALDVPQEIKLLIAICFSCLLGFSYFDHRFLRDWSDTQVCVWDTGAMCLSVKTLNLVALSNELLFTMKLVIAFFLGYPYAVLRASFVTAGSQATYSLSSCIKKLIGRPVKVRDSQRRSVVWGSGCLITDELEAQRQALHRSKARANLSEHVQQRAGVPTPPSRESTTGGSRTSNEIIENIDVELYTECQAKIPSRSSRHSSE